LGQVKGVILNPLKRIVHPKGDIWHAIKQTDDGYSGFGEAYFSNVNFNEIKGWKKHTEMILNIVVPFGEIEFCIYDDREGSETYQKKMLVRLSAENYQRLTVPANLWLAFKGCSKLGNTLLNISNIEHNPTESINRDLSEITFEDL
jgi:dTDP-4-dehydrorhamnose 3,5-epimerase